MSKQKTYMITGGAGFIGSHLVREALQRGFKVVVVDNFVTGKKENLAGVISDIDLIEGDIRDKELMDRLCGRCDVILHQAALRSVPRSIDDPGASNDCNVTGTLNLLIAARDNEVQRVVYASSSSIYGDTPSLPKSEEQRPLPISPYAVSKLAGEHYCRAFSHTFDLETVSLRYFNVFGPRQDPESKYAAVVPIFFKQALEGFFLSVHGDGKQSRDFTYVKNVVSANFLAAQVPGVSGEAFNVACGNRHSILDIADEVLKNTSSDVGMKHGERRKGDVEHTQADISKAERMLGYKPTVDFYEGMKLSASAYMKEKKK
ncbi:MAG: SDR family oxidoreductase [Elusimicrobiota bacterium]